LELKRGVRLEGLRKKDGRHTPEGGAVSTTPNLDYEEKAYIWAKKKERECGRCKVSGDGSLTLVGTGLFYPFRGEKSLGGWPIPEGESDFVNSVLLAGASFKRHGGR